VHKGIGRDRQETSGCSGAMVSSGTMTEADCAFSNSSARLTSLKALRLLAVFRTLLWLACKMYSLPVLTIEKVFMRDSRCPNATEYVVMANLVPEQGVMKTCVVYRALTRSNGELCFAIAPRASDSESVSGRSQKRSVMPT
jgi:hypothetical protein